MSQVVKKLWDLKLFSDIRVYAVGISGNPDDDIIDTVDLEFNIIEVPTLNIVEIEGIKKGQRTDLLKELNLSKGAKANENLVTTTRNFIEKKYKDKGFLNADALVRVREVKDTLGNNDVDMKIDIDKGEKVKIESITFEGNSELSDKKLRKAMKNTKEKSFFVPVTVMSPKIYSVESPMGISLGLCEKAKVLVKRSNPNSSFCTNGLVISL